MFAVVVVVTDTFACKICGLRQKQATQSHFEDIQQDDGTRLIKIEGCDVLRSFYRTYKYTMTQINVPPSLGFEPGSLGTVSS